MIRAGARSLFAVAVRAGPALPQLHDAQARRRSQSQSRAKNAAREHQEKHHVKHKTSAKP